MLLDQVPAWSVGTQLVVAGGAAFVVVDRLQRAARSGADRSAPWVAWFAFVLAAGLVANVWVLSAAPAQVNQVAFVRSVLLIATAITLVPVAARLAGVHVPRWAMWALGAVGGVRLVMWPTSKYVSAHTVSVAGAPEYGSLVLATTVPAAVLVVAGVASVVSRWDDRVERRTFATGVSAAVAMLIASFLAAPALAEVLTGWGLVPLVLATVAIVVRRHRHRDDRVDELTEVVSVAQDRVRSLEVRSDLACEAAGAGWWEYEPASGRFVASDAAWEMLETTGESQTVRAGSVDGVARDATTLEVALQHLRSDVRTTARHRLQARSEVAAHRVPLQRDERWLEVSARRCDASSPSIVGIARDVSTHQRETRAVSVRHARGLHLGAHGPADVASICDAWLAAGQRVTVFVLEVRGLDELGLVGDERVVAAALTEMAHRVAWAQPRHAQTALLSDRHLVLVVPRPVPRSAAGDADELAVRLHGLFDRPVEVDGRTARLSASIGIAEGPDDGGRLGVLAARARAVAVRARSSMPTTRFDVDAADSAVLQMHLSSHVVWALQHGAIQVAFQPVVDARTGVVRSVEALVRCWHPDLGEVPTEQIVETAERHDSGVELFRTVLRASLFALRDWRAVGLLESVSVNVAPHLLADPRTLEAVDEALRDTGVPADALLLEITEHVAMDDLVAHGVRFRDRGVRIAIDDFGVGQSTVGRLAGLMVDVVKLDRSLVSGLDEDTRRERVVSLTNDVVHHLGAEVVAEGVETEPEAAALREAGVDGLQGFGMCRPLPFEAMSAYLEEMRRHRRAASDD